MDARKRLLLIGGALAALNLGLSTKLLADGEDPSSCPTGDATCVDIRYVAIWKCGSHGWYQGCKAVVENKSCADDPADPRPPDSECQ